MLKTNQYFDGRVASIGLTVDGARATVGVMLPGEYRFETAAPERMEVISGALIVRLPGSDDVAADGWQTFAAGGAFDVPGDAAFDLRVEVDTAYLCRYG